MLEGLISYSLLTIESGVARDYNDVRNLQRSVATVFVAAVSSCLRPSSLSLPLHPSAIPSYLRPHARLYRAYSTETNAPP
jgi:hypothetical protein